ncbi:hypothetical protein PGT21_014383 [Puccinia graminis f. sp. tritici]|uniref:Uncharacterized protein n=1 Tax=Puccinia graminis f. sp. tritici TaxID=56615 RepID=A0A5B0M8K1_PUCGR|nr:hypothetical protein PGT21_014383 [Puccinia graminis f. sp. tritici]
MGTPTYGGCRLLVHGHSRLKPQHDQSRSVHGAAAVADPNTQSGRFSLIVVTRGHPWRTHGDPACNLIVRPRAVFSSTASPPRVPVWPGCVVQARPGADPGRDAHSELPTRHYCIAYAGSAPGWCTGRRDDESGGCAI